MGDGEVIGSQSLHPFVLEVGLAGFEVPPTCLDGIEILVPCKLIDDHWERRHMPEGGMRHVNINNQTLALRFSLTIIER